MSEEKRFGFIIIKRSTVVLGSSNSLLGDRSIHIRTQHITNPHAASK